MEWKRVVVLLEGKFDPRDISLLMDYCITHAEILDLRVRVGSDEMLMGVKGGCYMNPLLTVMMNRQAHLSALRRDLYFTPKSRIEKQSKGTLSKAKQIKNSVEAQGDDDQD